MTDLDALAEVDRAGRIGRTTVQVGVPSAVATLFEWACALRGWDLDPWSEGTGLPSSVSVALVGVLTVLLAYAMNRKPPAEPAPAHDMVQAAAAVADTEPERPRRRPQGDK